MESILDSVSGNSVLGCTELPVIYERLGRRDFLKPDVQVFDPLECVIERLRADLK